MTKINDKLQKQEPLNTVEKCVADQVVSSIIDRKNILLYTATFDLMSRVYITQKAQEVSYCRTMIIGSRRTKSLDAAAKNCPEELKQLTNEQLIDLDKHAMKLAQAASDLKNSPVDIALGSCINL